MNTHNVIDKLKSEYTFVYTMEVRDYELDCEQIVNNANYLHYMEHTRHKFCEYAGIPFIEMHTRGLDAVVRKIDIEYLSSLRSGQEFHSALNIERKGPAYIFHQDIFNTDGQKVTAAKITCVILRDGRLTRGDDFLPLFQKYLS